MIDDLHQRCFDAAVAVLAGHDVPPPPVEPLVVEHVVDGDSDRFVHHQVWAGDRLRAWAPGPHPRPHVQLVRSQAVERAHLVGDVGHGHVAAATTIVVDGVAIDPLGTPGTLAKDFGGRAVDAEVRSVVRVPDGPLGPFAVDLTMVHSTLTIADATSVAEHGPPVDINLEMTYADVLEWFWGDLIVGHLLWRERLPLRGDVFALAALEGAVRAPTLDAPPDRTIDVLRRWHRAELGPDAAALRARVSDQPATMRSARTATDGVAS